MFKVYHEAYRFLAILLHGLRFKGDLSREGLKFSLASVSLFSDVICDQPDTFIRSKEDLPIQAYRISFSDSVIHRFNPVGVGVVHGANNPWFHPGLLGLNSFRVQ
jgi:hypothetical protein